jgi:membrane protease subunit (stomatin/prohibitin family)
MREAARNEGGGAGLGMGMGAGIGLGQSMAQSMGQPESVTQQNSIPKANKPDPMAKLAQLKKMFEAELITEQEYAAKKQSILDKM